MSKEASRVNLAVGAMMRREAAARFQLACQQANVGPDPDDDSDQVFLDIDVDDDAVGGPVLQDEATATAAAREVLAQDQDVPSVGPGSSSGGASGPPAGTLGGSAASANVSLEVSLDLGP
jgi:hypothetical protein